MHELFSPSSEHSSHGAGVPAPSALAMETSASNTVIRVLLVEDYDLVRRGIELLLKQYAHLAIVGSAANRAQALQIAEQEKPDVVLLDLLLGEDDGLDLLPELLELGAKNVIVFTGMADADVHHSALMLGAKAVIEKGQPAEELANCISRVHAGETVQFEAESLKITRLSKTERDVVSLLCAGAKNEDILGLVGLSSLQMVNTLKEIQRKLEVPDSVALVVYAFRHGLARTCSTG